MRNLMLRRSLQHQGGKHPSLYTRYRGTGFPLRVHNGKIPPPWRSLTPWMKVQIATLVLSERGYLQFKVHIHDDLRERWVSSGRDLKVELRNSITRHLKRRFDFDPPGFFFVMEDRTTGGQPTRPHAHGSIELRRTAPPTRGLGSRELLQLSKTDPGRAELRAGRLKIKEALWAASGGREPRISIVTGLDQVRNVWLQTPRQPIFNSQWVDYAFKNIKEISSTLGEGRLAMHQPLLQESRRLWNLIREGESAIEHWG